MQGQGQGQGQRKESKVSIRGQVRGWVTVSDRGQESMGRAILGSDCRVRVRGMGQESNVKTIPRARVQGKGKSQRVKDRGLVNGQGHTQG